MKFKKVSNSARLPEYSGGVFTFFSDIGTNKGIQPGRSYVVTTGILVSIPDNSIGIISLVEDFMGPDTNLVLSESLKFLKPGTEEELQIKISNTDITTRVIRNQEPLCELILVPIVEFKEFEEKEEEDGESS